MFNQNEGHPTADPAVRKAIVQALDLDRLNEVQSYGAGERIYNLGLADFPCSTSRSRSSTQSQTPLPRALR